MCVFKSLNKYKNKELTSVGEQRPQNRILKEEKYLRNFALSYKLLNSLSSFYSDSKQKGINVLQ